MEVHCITCNRNVLPLYRVQLVKAGPNILLGQPGKLIKYIPIIGEYCSNCQQLNRGPHPAVLKSDRKGGFIRWVPQDDEIFIEEVNKALTFFFALPDYQPTEKKG